MLKDEQLMMDVASGDLQRLSILFDRYHVRIFNFFYKMNHNKALSEDLTQNVFERIIKYKHSYNGSNPFVPWIFRIARNVNADHHKGMKLKISEGVDLQKMDTLDEPIEEQNEQKQVLRKAMSKLPTDYREVLLMTRFQGLQYNEVADILQCSESNVKVRVHRAIKALRKEYLKIETIN